MIESITLNPRNNIKTENHLLEKRCKKLILKSQMKKGSTVMKGKRWRHCNVACGEWGVGTIERHT